MCSVQESMNTFSQMYRVFYICGNPNLGDVSTSVGAYSNFIESMLHEFQGLNLRSCSSHILHEIMMKIFQSMHLCVIAHPARLSSAANG